MFVRAQRGARATCSELAVSFEVGLCIAWRATQVSSRVGYAALHIHSTRMKQGDVCNGSTIPTGSYRYAISGL